MPLETATYISDFVASNPVGGSDQKAQGDDHLRLIKSVLQGTFPNATKAFRFPQILSKSANYSMLVGDENSLVLVDSTGASRTISLPNTGTIAAGYKTTIFKQVAANSVIVDTPGAETINGANSITLTSQYGFLNFEWDGTTWNVVGRNDFIATLLAAANTFTASNIFLANQTIQSDDAGAIGPQLFGKHNSASPANGDGVFYIVAQGKDSAANDQDWAKFFAEIVDVTSASEDAKWVWQTVIAGALASRMHLGAGMWMDGASGGDLGAGVVNAVAVYDDNVQIRAQTLGTAAAATSGTAVSFTGLPTGIKRIQFVLNEVSLSGTDNLLIQLSTGAAFVTSGYVGTTAGTSNGAASSTAGFPIRSSNAAHISSGIMTLVHIGGNIWIASYAGKGSTADAIVGGGSISLGGVLDGIRITRSGTDTFDGAGSVNILYE